MTVNTDSHFKGGDLSIDNSAVKLQPIPKVVGSCPKVGFLRPFPQFLKYNRSIVDYRLGTSKQVL